MLRIKEFYYRNQLKAISQGQSYADKIKLELSYKSLWALALLLCVILGIVLVQGYDIYAMLLPICVFVSLLIGVYFVVVFRRWRSLVHVFSIILILTLGIEIFYFSSTTDFLLMQYCFVVITISFIFSSNKYGFIYSGIVTCIVMVILYKRFYTFPIITHIDNKVTLILCLSITAFLVFICYSFLKAFNRLVANAEKARAEELVLNEKLIQITEEANVSVKHQRDFLSSMSHELRTPLNSVIGFSQLLLDETPHKEQTENLNFLLHSAEGLLSLINDVLDYNKLESGNLVLEQVSFQLLPLVKKVFEGHRVAAQNKNIQYTFNFPPTISHYFVIGDQIRLYQILYNLIDNALKFNKEGGDVVLNIELIEDDPDQIKILFQVVDTGKGLSIDDIEKVLNPNFDNQEERANSGLGLGLGTSIVNQLLMAHHTLLKCSSSIGEGSTFSFELRYLLDSDINQNIVEMDIRQLLKGLKILLVEDNQMNILLMNKIFEGWDISYALANNGLEATEMAANENFDLIIMDINMPIMNGFEASKLIKKHNPNSRIIALSASLKEEIKGELSASKIDGFLSKPFSKQNLRMLIYQLCS